MTPRSEQGEVNVTLPRSVWGRIASIADDRGITVQDLLVAAIGSVLQPRDRRERVLQALYAGLPDGVVAERTGELRQYVAQVRRAEGLPPVKDRPTAGPMPREYKNNEGLTL